MRLRVLFDGTKRWHSVRTNFVPKHEPVSERDIAILHNFIWQSGNVLVVTGAGISTESGIPDYRSEGVGLYARTNQKPIQYQEFIRSQETRKRYWARNFVGWDRFSQCEPNVSHKILRDLELAGPVSHVITQNVDGLHGKAGSRRVVELHGSAFRVSCLDCGQGFDRHKVQRDLILTNPDMGEVATMIRPDGDVEIPVEKVKKFCPPFCAVCGGALKPDIVFFGDNVPKSRVDQVRQAVCDCDAVLVLGSTLTVFSSYRIVLQAVELGKDVCIVNIGETRADELAKFKIEAKCGEILSKIV